MLRLDFSEKLKLIRKTHGLTQAEFASMLGISRGNLASLELGNVKPTKLLITCISLIFNIEKSWLTDSTNTDLTPLNPSTNLTALIIEKYEQLNDDYKNFVKNQISELLEIQEGHEKK